MCADPVGPYARPVLLPRSWLAGGLLVAAGALPVLALRHDWGWYLDGPLLLLTAVLGGYAAGVWLPRWTAVLGGLLVVSSLVVVNQRLDQEYHWLDDAVFFLLVVGVPVTVGAVVGLRARQLRRLEQLSARLEEQGRLEVAAARMEEQSRVQQLLHARLAERIAGISLRATGALRSGDATALADLESESRGVLDQLREALGVLRLPPVDGTAGRTGPDRPPARAPGPQGPTVLDVVLSLGLGGALAVETLVSSHSRGPSWGNVVAAVVVAAPLVLRRPRPLTAVGATTLAAALSSLWLTPLARTVTGVALVTVVFLTVGAWCRGRSWPLGLGVAAVGTALVGLASGVTSQAALAVLAWGLAAAVLGRLTAGWRDRLQQTEDVVARLEDGRGAALRLALARERQMLAGELHDTVAHAMTVVCLQTGAARRTGADPSEVLRIVAQAAAGSLEELRYGLDASEVTGSRIESAQIVALGRALGVDVDVTTPPVEVGGQEARLGLRVLREALVNAARHAPGATARVAVTCEADRLGVEVLDDGSREQPLLRGSGRGLTGLAVTVSVVGGTLDWGPGEGGGFRVRASIPQVSG